MDNIDRAFILAGSLAITAAGYLFSVLVMAL